MAAKTEGAVCMGLTIARERGKQGIKRSQLAWATKLSPTRIAQIEQGSVPASVEEVRAIAHVLQCPEWYLYGFSVDEHELIALVRTLSPTKKSLLIKFARVMSETARH